MLAQTPRRRDALGSAPSPSARRLAASAGGDDVALATTADGLVEGPTSDTRADRDRARSRSTPAGGDDAPWPRVAGHRRRALHHRRRASRARSTPAVDRALGLRGRAERRHHRVRAVRPATSADGGGEAYLEVANYAPPPQPVRITLTRGTAVAPRSVGRHGRRRGRAPGRAARRATGDARLRARVDAPDNALADRRRRRRVDCRAPQPLAVTVVSDQPAPLRRLLRTLRASTPTFVTPAAYQARARRRRHLRSLAAARRRRRGPRSASRRRRRRGSDTSGAVEQHAALVACAATHPRAGGRRSADRRHQARATRTTAPASAPIARSDAGHAARLGRRSRRIGALVIVTFALGDSNLAFAPAFPVLVGNALEWLARPASGEPRGARARSRCRRARRA